MNIFSQIINQIKVIFLGLVVGLSPSTKAENIFPTQAQLPTPTVIAEVAFQPELMASIAPSLAPTGKPKPISTPKPVPSIATDFDLNLQSITLRAEKGGVGDKVGPTTISLRSLNRNNNRIKLVQFVVRNNGKEDVKNVTVKFIADGSTLFEYSIDLLEKQSEKRELKQVELPDKLGKHNLEIQINQEKRIIESTYNNNSRIIEYEYFE